LPSSIFCFNLNLIADIPRGIYPNISKTDYYSYERGNVSVKSIKTKKENFVILNLAFPIPLKPEMTSMWSLEEI
jgi:hypothetical protein